MSDIVLSVIVPVYGVEKYIERCARSLFEQTLTDGIEYVFVDDGTPDGSIEILNAVLADYPNRRPQVRVLKHGENKGLPYARKTGLLAARGEYVFNVDSDDWLEPDFCEKLLAEARSSDADIVACDMFFSTGTEDVKVHQPVRLKTEDYLFDMMSARNLWAIWNKIIRRRLYFVPELIIFPEYYMGEDMLQLSQLMSRAEKISYVPEHLYHYYQNPNSFAAQTDKSKFYVWFEMLSDNVEKTIKVREGKNSDKVNQWLRMRAKTMLYPLLQYKGGRREYLNAYKELNYKIIFNGFAPLKARLKHLGILLGLTSLVFKLDEFKRRIRKY